MRTTRFGFGAAILALAAGACVAQTVPAGFAYDQLISGLDQPSALALLPDGRILACEGATGTIRVYVGGVGNSMPLIGAVSATTRVLSIAVDSQWPSRPFVYVVYRSSASATLWLSMFTVSGDLSIATSANLSLGAQYDIITDIPNFTQQNSAGIRFGLDGKLYLSMGDDGNNNCGTQNPSSELGCIFRIDVSGLPGAGPGPPPKSTLVPAGNPFSGPTDNARLVWAYGLRRPFRFHVEPVTGTLDIADTGSAYAEVDECTTPGQYFGWPWMDGNVAYGSCPAPQPPLVAPMLTVSLSTSVTWGCGMGRYRNVLTGAATFGLAYEGDYFYSYTYLDQVTSTQHGLIERLHWNGSTWQDLGVWGTDILNVGDAQRGPDGAIYFVQTAPGILARIRCIPALQPNMLAMVSGNDQPGNGGHALPNPVVVRLTNFVGTPIVGGAVNFNLATGGGSVSPANAITDSQGYAQTTFTMPSTFVVNPTITVTSPGSPNVVTFNMVWRGLVASYSSLFHVISVAVHHSQTNSPVTLCWERPPAGVPYLNTPWNPVWTSVLAPVAGFGALDGLGLLGSANPSARTPTFSTAWLFNANLPPQGSVPFLLQAYAIDTSLLPSDAAYMISNPVTVTIN